MFIFKFVVQILNKRHFLVNTAPLILTKEVQTTAETQLDLSSFHFVILSAAYAELHVMR